MLRQILPLVTGLSLATVAMAGEPVTTTLSVTGLGCRGCVAALERQIGSTEGVTAYAVRADKGEAAVTYDPDKTDAGAIGASLLDHGFDVRLAPWEPVDASFLGCSNGWCGSRRPNATVSAQPGAAPGHDVYCPVSGVVLRIKESTLSAEVDGKPVYVCCEGCLRHFKAHQDRVLALRGMKQRADTRRVDGSTK
jgi:copper chaperone